MHPRYIYEEYTPKINNTWTGDCWKLAYELSLQKYKMQIIMIDFGIGIFKNLGKKFELNDDNFKKIKKLDFNFFYECYLDTTGRKWGSTYLKKAQYIFQLTLGSSISKPTMQRQCVARNVRTF